METPRSHSNQPQKKDTTPRKDHKHENGVLGIHAQRKKHPWKIGPHNKHDVTKTTTDAKHTQLQRLPKINAGDSLLATKQGADDKDENGNVPLLDLKEVLSDVHYEDVPILRYIQDNIIGQDLVIQTPYGSRKMVYCDYTASGRSLRFIEDFIRDKVYPTYANTHSTTGHNARQTGKFREEARAIIKRCVNASNNDVVIFTGSGATSGIHKVAWGLGINKPRIAAETVVFIGPYEHHSNILPWREYGTQVVRIKEESDTGMVDLEHLESQLKFWHEKRRQMLVCMSAASNVTGIVTDCDVISALAHKHGTLAIFDYAGGGPYLNIDMNVSKLSQKDAVILSPHKFVGGPGTPGIVIAKKWIFRNSVPDRVGGGTVSYVTRDHHKYTSNIEEREEGGTPAIVESIRAGLVFKLKQEVGTDVIHAREEELCGRAFDVWERNPALHVLGNHRARRVTIFSFVTRHLETGRLIHHNYISTLLSDLFGIQARGGCACAGPYAADLLGVSGHFEKIVTSMLADKPGKDRTEQSTALEIMKPGFTRINLSYFMDDDSIDYVINAVDMVTRHGWKLLPQYTFDLQSGSWRHKSFSNTPESELNTLDDVTFDVTTDHENNPHAISTSGGPSYTEVLSSAQRIFQSAHDHARKSRITTCSLALRDVIPRAKRKFRWFLTPHEARNILADIEEEYLERSLYRMPFEPQPVTHRLHNEDDIDNDSDVFSETSSNTRSHQTSSEKDGHAHARYLLTPEIDDTRIHLRANKKTGNGAGRKKIQSYNLPDMTHAVNTPRNVKAHIRRTVSLPKNAVPPEV